MKQLLYRVGVLGFAVASLALSAAVLRQPTPETSVIQARDDLFFTVSPDLVERDGQVTLSWRVPGVDHVAMEQRYGSHKTAAQALYENLPAEGSLTVDLRTRTSEHEQGIPYIHNVIFTLLAPSDEPIPFLPQGYRYVESTSARIRCPYEGFFFGADEWCPLGESQTVEMIYQPFEHGMMVWRSDTNTSYALSTLSEGSEAVDGSAVSFPYPENTAWETAPLDPLTIPAGRFAPDARFTGTLNHGLVMSFGWPTAPAMSYEGTVQDSYSDDSLTSEVAYFTLPDQRVIGYEESLYSSGWRCKRCKTTTSTP